MVFLPPNTARNEQKTSTVGRLLVVILEGFEVKSRNDYGKAGVCEAHSPLTLYLSNQITPQPLPLYLLDTFSNMDAMVQRAMGVSPHGMV